ncbi:hypothetical protein PFICI_07554 [Pestalotiopsis fici W106-1]|uniref:Uncharacterized protein n=1 Tax=Pestalotiopsis fici (strain W106-1 / CGMCC3.15140) TaxID=1229662 RepID=W3X1S3_PESFW|nr:uncharacterized protein PFICI_07554 [Pestalotiopsis fici W106-1]ETS80025.1 hypothetical protein PFICI_07554 [Pestalotiopsis fici W106-1]
MQSQRTFSYQPSEALRPPSSSGQPGGASTNVRPSINLHRGTHYGSSVRGTYTAGRADLDGLSQHTILETPNTERAGWIDDEYLEQNPWYDQPKRKPVFSLGRPLPRLVRGPKKVRVKKNAANKNRPLEELAERGELELATPTPTPGIEGSGQFDHVLSSQTTRGSARPEHTANGTAHNDRRNVAGQPVFDYTPGVPEQEQRAPSPRPDDAGSTAEYKIDGEPLGKREHDDYENGERDLDELRNWWARMRAKHPEPLAEFLSTAVAIFLGLAGTLSVNLSQNESQPYGTYETSCWAWGFAWMFGVYLGGGVSGAHMNPAISISLSLFRGFPWRQCMVYVVVQFIAAIVAGALAYGCYADTIYYMDPSLENTSKAFISTPQSWVSPGNAFLNQSVGSAIMVIVVFALGDDQNNPPGAGMHAFVLGLLVAILKMALGFNIGSALNPASDFGPRLIAYAVGYHQDTVFKNPWWFYGPWAATFVGSILGCVIYDTFVFVGSESPVNYRYPPTIRRKIEKKGRQIKQKGHQVLNHLSSSNNNNNNNNEKDNDF